MIVPLVLQQLGPRASAYTMTVSVLLAVNACASPMRKPPANGGTVTVGVSTRGSAIDALRFRVAIEPAGIIAIVNADAGVFTRSGVPLGSHVVRLLELPAHCRPDGGGERHIALTLQRPSAVLRFDVVCD